MKNYDVYFEIYGKKMKATILAEGEADAKQTIKDKIIFHKVVRKPNDEFNKIDDLLSSIIDILGVKKK